jgi:hypothetical protein
MRLAKSQPSVITVPVNREQGAVWPKRIFIAAVLGLAVKLLFARALAIFVI